MLEDGEITTFDKKGREIELTLKDTESLYKKLARYWGRQGALKTPLHTRKKYAKMGGDKRWSIEKN